MKTKVEEEKLKPKEQQATKRLLSIKVVLE